MRSKVIRLKRDVIRERRELADLIFRVCFSLIFILLGGEHLFRDSLMQGMMPDWLPGKRLFSVLSGLVILGAGGCILVGFLTRIGAWALIVFLVPVTVLVHLRLIGLYPGDYPAGWEWLWDVYHQGSILKNLALIGASIHFAFNGAGRLSVDGWRERNRP